MRGPGRRFEKGRSGNPTGRPKEDQTITELARAYGPRAIEVLAELMDDPKASPSVRVAAAERILDRAYGKPAQFSTSQAQEFRKAVDMTDDELAATVAAGRGSVLKLVGSSVGTDEKSGKTPAAIIARAEPAPTGMVEPKTEQPPPDPKKVN